MNFSQARAYLLGTINETASRREPYRLDRMRTFLHELGDPQNAYPTVHVGGTSGKGSTSTMAAAALTAAGKRTALHTKPHLRSMVERARIDGVPITEEQFADLLTEMMPAITATAEQNGRPSYYETLLALAFTYFERMKVDVAVIEVGIGGKLDGTNVLLPRVCAITNVGLDHTEILGETLEEIAADKAGIAKPGIPLVSAVEDPGARAVIEAQCRSVGAPFISVIDSTTIREIDSGSQYGQHFSVLTPRGEYDVSLPVLGQFQQLNAATAILCLEQLDESLRPSREDVERGLAHLNLIGRMEFFPGHPSVLFDVAHNPDKAAHLADALRRTFPDRRFTFVIAVGESKDAQEILRAFAGLPSSFIFTSFSTQGRTASRPTRLASVAQSLGVWGRSIADPIEALSIARRNAAADDVIVVTGSTFIVAELREWWMEHVVATQSTH
ncbi:MAG TPA: folylpolyglutamate synthase/dihydrofolate synthase family protein [Candidatus Baltobacteraceae bacterium]|jgi:dihydrofolate synthase/folylpolyglutamate synthase|nr:folylpolyglutamate synthase/dihydrofolate synthase family protein [Candidatus Baltobacteraceae bacterium]